LINSEPHIETKMLRQIFLNTLVAAATILAGMGLTNLPSTQAFAQTTRFFCDTSNGTPATVAQTARGKVVMIRWVTTLADGEYTPLKRCSEVSDRFQRFSQKGQLRFVTSGRVRLPNGSASNIICVAAANNGECLKDGLLFTLKPGSEPRKVLATMFRLNLAGSSGGELRETTSRVYVNVDDCLNNQECSVAR
jgi:hypothetical protein